MLGEMLKECRLYRQQLAVCKLHILVCLSGYFLFLGARPFITLVRQRVLSGGGEV